MLKRDADFWFDMWSKKNNILFQIIEWLADEKLDEIGQSTFLEYAIGVFLANPKSFESTKFKNEIKKSAIYLTLTNQGFSKSNLSQVEDLYKISKKITNNNQLSRYEYKSPIYNKLNLSIDDILKATNSNYKFRTIKNLLYKDNIGGRFVTNILNSKNDKETDIHHIYPKSAVNDFKTNSIFNSIANIICIPSNVNRIEIKDKLPCDYFGILKELSDNNLDYCCTQNLIELNGVLNISTEYQAEKFIKKRAEKIADHINEYF